MNMTKQVYLHAHPTTPCDEVESIVVEISPQAQGNLRLTYRITHRPGALRIPAATEPRFADGLWEHTCLEAFIAPDAGPAYREFNFSPSGQWAVYAFHAYRKRDTGYSSALAPHIETDVTDTCLRLSVVIPAELIPQSDHFKLGLTAVIELVDGRRSYWALAHSGVKPDFHQKQAFCVSLTQPK